MDNPKPAPLGIVIAFGVATVIAGVLLAWKCHRYDEAQRAEERVRQLCEDAQEANNQILQARSAGIQLPPQAHQQPRTNSQELMDEVGRVERNIQRELDGRRDRQRDDADDGFELLTLEPVKLKSDT